MTDRPIANAKVEIWRFRSRCFLRMDLGQGRYDDHRLQRRYLRQHAVRR